MKMKERSHLCPTPRESLFGRINGVAQVNVEIPKVTTRRRNRRVRKVEKVATTVVNRRPEPLLLPDLRHPQRLLHPGIRHTKDGATTTAPIGAGPSQTIERRMTTLPAIIGEETLGGECIASA